MAPKNGSGRNGASHLISDYLAEARALLERVERSDVERAASLLVEAHRRGASVFAVGNGGSASTASHLVSDLTKSTQEGGVPPLRALSLSDNVPLLTAWANDACYEECFAAQLRAHARLGDVLVAVSASGNSPNILTVAREAQQMGLPIIALTGFGGGRLKDLADAAVTIDSHDYGQVEGAHLVLVHLLSGVVVKAAQHFNETGAGATAVNVARIAPDARRPAEVPAAREAVG
jgi:D-sedoheptulose 7-phosphate isomerase